MKTALSRTFLAPLILAPLLAFTSKHTLAQQDFSDVKIETQKVTDNIYMLMGRGGNIGVSVGDDGIFIIDDQYAPLSDKILAALRAIHPGSVRFVINTHWHGDHTGGNENLGRGGATIIAHEHVRARLQMGRIDLFDLKAEATPAAKLPLVTFNDQLGLNLNGEAVRVYHVANGHTDGDAIVHFPASNVLHLGDLYFSTGYPFVDRTSGGTFVGLQRAIEFALELADDETRIIPGHGPLASRADLQRYHQMLLDVREAVQERVDRGLDLAATLVEKPTAQWDADWGTYFMTGDQITTIVWQSLMLDQAQP